MEWKNKHAIAAVVPAAVETAVSIAAHVPVATTIVETIPIIDVIVKTAAAFKVATAIEEFSAVVVANLILNLKCPAKIYRAEQW